jgi:hypothetical protein
MLYPPPSVEPDGEWNTQYINNQPERLQEAKLIMATNMTASMPNTPIRPTAHEPLHCALTGKPISADEAYWAPPLVTARELVTTVAKTAWQSPGLLGVVLMAEQPDVPYAPEVREQLAARRSAEQAKLLVLLLIVLAIIVTPILLFVF